MRYVDVEDSENYTEPLRRLTHGRTLPLVLIEDEILFEGGIPWRGIVKTIKEQSGET